MPADRSHLRDRRDLVFGPSNRKAVRRAEGKASGPPFGGAGVQAIVLTASSQSLASGGAYVQWGTVHAGIQQKKWDAAVTTPTSEVEVPYAGWLGVGVERLAWDTYVGGGVVRYELWRDGSLVGSETFSGDTDTGSVFSDSSGLWVRAGDAFKVKVSQGSGSAKTLAGAKVELTLWRQGGVERALSELLFTGDVWALVFDGTNWWTTEGPSGNTVSKRNTAGVVLSSFEAATSGRSGDLAWDGTDLWLSGHPDILFRYNTSGVKQQEFALEDSPGGHTGVAWDGTHVWVIDNNAGVEEAERYTTAGALASKFALPAGNYFGLHYHDSHLWIVDTANAQLLKYTTAGTQV
ncbi:MAG: hypothetical protein ACRDUY_08800, partial [Nitriliruptorales bacterium]